MASTIRACLLTLLVTTLPAASLADAQRGQGFVSAMVSYVDDDPDRRVDDGVLGGQVGLGRAFHDYWNVEAMVSFGSASGPAEQDQLAAGLDLQLVFARESRFSPYLFAGAGYFWTDLQSGDRHDGNVFSGGVGFFADIFGSSNVALRAEYRYRSDRALGATLDDQVASIGLQIPFGGRRAPPPPVVHEDPDSDGDGVTDGNDRCPDTPAGIPVDARGCPFETDGDGVYDYLDDCPGTARGAVVDERGCELDGDNDGVVDRLDRCPDTRAGAQVDARGCEIRDEIDLPGVNFETNSDRLLPGAESVLRDAAAALIRNPTIKVEVAGHTDSDGPAEYNEGLSARRAATVRDFLITQGVSPERMSTWGYGESQPIADNATAAGKAQNRRVVLRIIER